MDGVLTTQARVIGALVLRETRSAFGDTQLGYLWAIVNPALSTLVLVAIFFRSWTLSSLWNQLCFVFCDWHFTIPDLFKALKHITYRN